LSRVRRISCLAVTMYDFALLMKNEPNGHQPEPEAYIER